MTPFNLKNKYALVCGASQGIGRATAVVLSQLGACVIALARSKDKLEILKTEFGIQPLVADLEKPDDLKSRVTELIAKTGGIHILVNNTAGPRPGPLLSATDEEFIQAFARHVLTSQMLVNLCLPGMKKDGYGRIINVISTSVREPIPNLGVSNTIRGATASWAKTLASELPPGITVNSVLPGYTSTPRLESLKKATADKMKISPEDVEKMWLEAIPEKRIADPSEIAQAIAFLASPWAGYIRGVSLAVDGGRMRSI
jgi:3-oxoacyl-[acyl-carrier protein] reductase